MGIGFRLLIKLRLPLFLRSSFSSTSSYSLQISTWDERLMNTGLAFLGFRKRRLREVFSPDGRLLRLSL